MEHGAGVGHAPVDIVVHTQAVTGSLTLIVVAKAFSTRAFAAAVVIGDQVVAAILRIQACSYP